MAAKPFTECVFPPSNTKSVTTYIFRKSQSVVDPPAKLKADDMEVYHTWLKKMRLVWPQAVDLFNIPQLVEMMHNDVI